MGGIMRLFGWTDGDCADEPVHFLAVSCIKNTCLGENYLTSAKYTQVPTDKKMQKNVLFCQCDVHPICIPQPLIFGKWTQFS